MRFFKKPAAPPTPDEDGPGSAPPNVSVALAAVVDGVQGVIAAAVIDHETGLALATAGPADLDLKTAGAGHLEVFRAERDLLAVLGIDDRLEDILITLGSQYHLIRPLAAGQPLLLSIVFDRARANLGLARHHLRDVEARLGAAVAD
ncbi:MAG: roadblock/LC7 domain-containing protein [Gammaproteobacteria bacterium]|nr:roadblock/LC7 domain-containing protein [Gammaproteobacteria bacterium]